MGRKISCVCGHALTRHFKPVGLWVSLFKSKKPRPGRDSHCCVVGCECKSFRIDVKGELLPVDDSLPVDELVDESLKVEDAQVDGALQVGGGVDVERDVKG